MPRRAVFSALLALAPVAALAQQQPAMPAPAHHVVAPGSAEVRPRPVREGTDTLQMVMAMGNAEVPVARLIMETHVDRAAPGGPVIRRAEQTISNVVPATVDTFALVAATLAPVSQRTHDDPRTVALDFDGAGVHGTIAEGQSSGRVEVRLPVAVWYDNAMDLLLGSLPLAAGYEASLPVYDDASGRVLWRDIRVTGQEQVPGPGGAVNAWRVETTKGDKGSTYWMDPATGQMLVWSMKLNNGADLRIVR